MLIDDFVYHTKTIFLHIWYTLCNVEIHTIEVVDFKMTNDGENVLINGIDNGRSEHHVITLKSYLNFQVCKGGYITMLYRKKPEPGGAEVILASKSHTAFDWLGCSYHPRPAVIRDEGDYYLRDGTVSVKLSSTEYNRYKPTSCYLVPHGNGELKLIKS